MKIHHLNCATMCPMAGTLFAGQARFVCHCLLVETEEGLVLIDTGLGTADVADPDRLHGTFRHFLRPALDIEETAVEQIKRLGFDPADVRHIVLTHLDVDHAGGLPDFPEATVHLHRTEHASAFGEATFQTRLRHVAQQWSHGPRWEVYEADGEPWFGMEAVRQLEGLPPEILLVPLFGHSVGHSGVAVDTGNGWLLHAGDAFFTQSEIDPECPHCPPVLSLFQRMLQADGAMRLHNQQRLRELAKRDEVTIFCAHDPDIWAELSG